MEEGNSLQQPIVIPLSKMRLTKFLFLSLIFVAVGLWFIIAPPVIHNSFFGNPVLIAFSGYASLLFFGGTSIIIAVKMFDKKPGIIIDSNGFTDNTSASSVGRVAWEDVNYVGIVQVQRQKFIAVDVNTPEMYINRQNNFFKRKLIQLNFKASATPITINPNGFNMHFDELYAALFNAFKQSKRKSN